MMTGRMRSGGRLNKPKPSQACDSAPSCRGRRCLPREADSFPYKPTNRTDFDAKPQLNAASFGGLLSVISPDKTDGDALPDSLVLPQHECGLFGVFGHPNAAVL